MKKLVASAVTAACLIGGAVAPASAAVTQGATASIPDADSSIQGFHYSAGYTKMWFCRVNEARYRVTHDILRGCQKHDDNLYYFIHN